MAKRLTGQRHPPLRHGQVQAGDRVVDTRHHFDPVPAGQRQHGGFVSGCEQPNFLAPGRAGQFERHRGQSGSAQFVGSGGDPEHP